MVRYRWGLMLVGWLFLMFLFSSQPYEKQDMRQWLGRVMEQTGWHEALSEVAFTYGGRPVSIAALGPGGFAEFFVRKAAHLLEYAVAGSLLLLLLHTFFRSGKLLVPATMVIVVAIAAADEFHQSFVEGRTPLPDDVMLDIFGACVGVLLTLLILQVRTTVRHLQATGNPKERTG